MPAGAELVRVAVAELDLDLPLWHEVELLLALVVVAAGLPARRQDDGVDAELGHAELPADLAESVTFPEAVEVGDRVAGALDRFLRLFQAHREHPISSDPPMTNASAARIPAELQPGRRPLRLRALEGAPGGAREARRRRDGDGHLAPPAAGQGAGRRGSAAGLAELFGAARRLRGRCSATAARPRSGTPPRPGSSASAPLHLAYGEFSSKFAKATAAAPVPRRPDRDRGRARRRSRAARPTRPPTSIAWAHNETSTGVMVPVRRPGRCRRRARPGRRHLRRRRPAASTRPRPTPTTSRPQKGFGSDGGLWLALLSPAAMERITELDGAAGRWQPAFLSLAIALENSRKDQTYNTPARGDAAPARRPGRVDARLRRARLVRRALPRLVRRTSTAGPRRASSRRRSSPIRRSARRSSARSTSTRASTPRRIAATLRANGIVDTEPYRKLGRNQLRIGMFPAIEPADIEALTACIDWVVENAGGAA